MIQRAAWKQRYEDAHRKYQAIAYPSGTKDFGYISTNFPKVDKSNGLTLAICNFLNWSGYRATRINVSGRLIEQPEKQASGVILTTKKWMYSATRKGTADISATIFGRAVMLEIKVGRDKPREAQIEEQVRERNAGGIYEFIYNIDEFLVWYDQFILSLANGSV